MFSLALDTACATLPSDAGDLFISACLSAMRRTRIGDKDAARPGGPWPASLRCRDRCRRQLPLTAFWWRQVSAFSPQELCASPSHRAIRGQSKCSPNARGVMGRVVAGKYIAFCMCWNLLFRWQLEHFSSAHSGDSFGARPRRGCAPWSRLRAERLHVRNQKQRGSGGACQGTPRSGFSLLSAHSTSACHRSVFPVDARRTRAALVQDASSLALRLVASVLVILAPA